MIGEYISAVELQKAIYSSLSQSYPVFEVVPKNTQMPYYTIGEFSKIPDVTKTELDRYQYNVMLHSWSRGKSSSQSKLMNQLMLNHVNSLEVEGYSVEFVELTMETTLKEEEIDSTIFHGAQEFEITLNRKGD